MARENSKAIEKLKASQEEMKRALVKVSEQKALPPPMQPAPGVRKPERTPQPPYARARPRNPKGVAVRRLVTVNAMIVDVSSRNNASIGTVSLPVLAQSRQTFGLAECPLPDATVKASGHTTSPYAASPFVRAQRARRLGPSGVARGRPGTEGTLHGGFASFL